jgi:hypothetical protein
MHTIRLDGLYGYIYHRYDLMLGFILMLTLSVYQAQPAVGELRFIARLNRSPLPTGDPESYTDLGTSTVEGSDVVSHAPTL